MFVRSARTTESTLENREPFIAPLLQPFIALETPIWTLQRGLPVVTGNMAPLSCVSSSLRIVSLQNLL